MIEAVLLLVLTIFGCGFPLYLIWAEYRRISREVAARPMPAKSYRKSLEELRKDWEAKLSAAQIKASPWSFVIPEPERVRSARNARR